MNIQTSSHRRRQTAGAPRIQSTLAGQDKIGQALDNLTVSAFTMGTAALDVGMATGYVSGTENATFGTAGICVGAAHGIYGAGNFIAAIGAADSRNHDLAKHRINVGAGHVLSGVGHLCGAMGAGAWALGPILGGIALRTLEDYRVRS